MIRSNTNVQPPDASDVLKSGASFGSASQSRSVDLVICFFVGGGTDTFGVGDGLGEVPAALEGLGEFEGEALDGGVTAGAASCANSSVDIDETKTVAPADAAALTTNAPATTAIAIFVVVVDPLTTQTPRRIPSRTRLPRLAERMQSE